MSNIVHINGWPGVGKLTVARIVSQRVGYRLVDNHMLLNPAEVLFSRDDPLHGSLRKTIRKAFFEHAAQRTEPSLIFTNALADDPGDRVFHEEVAELANCRPSQLISVVLDCAEEENLRRLQDEQRKLHLKLTDGDVLKSIRSRYGLFFPENCLAIDTTHLPPEAVAMQIVDHIERVG